jgi:hypothetical protein
VKEDARVDRRDDCVITVSIPEWAVRCFATEPRCMFQPKPYFQRVIDYAIGRAVREYYFKMFKYLGGDGDE